MTTTMHDNPDFTDRLWSFVQGNADADLDAHVQACPECQEEMLVLTSLSTLRSISDTPPIPDTLTSTLKGLLTKVRPDLVQQPGFAPSISQRLKAIFADLIQDTALQPQIAGLRGEARTRQIAYTSDIADLDLEVSPKDDQFLVVGQLGMDQVPQNLNIRFVPAEMDPLSAHQDDANTASLSDQGRFRLNITPGDWVVTVEIEDAIVVFPGIKL